MMQNRPQNDRRGGREIHGKTRRAPGTAFSAAFVLLLLLGLVGSAGAQLPGGVTPDVQVVVMPSPMGGEWAVSAVYPKATPKKTMEAHYKRLLDLSGWKSGGVEYSTRGLQKNNLDFSKVKPGGRLNSDNLKPGGTEAPMSDLTFFTPSAVVDRKDATLPVEPFARAFRDLDRVYVTFFVPGEFPFRGLRRHSDANLDVMLAAQRGAYTYALTIKNHQMGDLKLPRYQVVKPEATVQTAARTASAAERAARQRRLLGASVVVLLAAATGLIVYAWANRWGGR